MHMMSKIDLAPEEQDAIQESAESCNVRRRFGQNHYDRRSYRLRKRFGHVFYRPRKYSQLQ